MAPTIRVLTPKEFAGNTDYAKSLRAIYGDDGYQKYSAKINSIIAEAKEKKETNKVLDNPMRDTMDARIAYLEQELQKATKDTVKKKNIFHRLCAKLSGMLKLTKSDETDHAIAQRNFAIADGDEDFYRFELLNAIHERGVLG